MALSIRQREFTMNEQQMVEKYRGIMQFQATHAQMKSENFSISVYYAKRKQDLATLILALFQSRLWFVCS
jgi:hypothetical protein